MTKYTVTDTVPVSADATFKVGDRVTYNGIPGTVIATRIVYCQHGQAGQLAEVHILHRLCLPPYQRIEADLDLDGPHQPAERIRWVEGASRFFALAGDGCDCHVPSAGLLDGGTEYTPEEMAAHCFQCDPAQFDQGAALVCSEGCGLGPYRDEPPGEICLCGASLIPCDCRCHSDNEDCTDHWAIAPCPCPRFPDGREPNAA